MSKCMCIECNPYGTPDDMADPKDVHIAELEARAGSGSDLERLCLWACENGYSTGHADTMSDLLDELLPQLEQKLAASRSTLAFHGDLIADYARLAEVAEKHMKEAGCWDEYCRAVEQPSEVK